ncbi:superinfection immunity protein [Parafrankia discariae]|uniref:superinfection immunity protein n=1 Tax=Parafrankia discariae TaxID=365528 RepID=UPI00389945F6
MLLSGQAALCRCSGGAGDLVKAVIWFYLLIGVPSYFLPSIIAMVRKRQVASVIVINFFLGWTIIGWVGSLALAVSSGNRDTSSQAVGIAYYPPPPRSRAHRAIRRGTSSRARTALRRSIRSPTPVASGRRSNCRGGHRRRGGSRPRPRALTPGFPIPAARAAHIRSPDHRRSAGGTGHQRRESRGSVSVPTSRH